MMTESKAPVETLMVARSGDSPISALGSSLVIHEWTDSASFYLQIQQTDDEAWHVLEGTLRFKLMDREVEAPAGTTVFVPAGIPYTSTVTEPADHSIGSPRVRPAAATGAATDVRRRQIAPERGE